MWSLLIQLNFHSLYFSFFCQVPLLASFQTKLSLLCICEMILETIFIWRKVYRLSRVFKYSGRNCLQRPGKLTEDICCLGKRRKTAILLMIKIIIISSLYIYDDSNVYSGLPQNKINGQDVVIFAMYRVCLFLGYVLYCIYFQERIN